MASDIDEVSVNEPAQIISKPWTRDDQLEHYNGPPPDTDDKLPRHNGLSPLDYARTPAEKEKPALSNLGTYNGWQEIELTVDSGACDTVMPLSSCTDIALQSSPAQGIPYEVANGNTIKNEGERRCLMMTMGSKAPQRIVFQVADVHKPLLSITRVADAGYECHLNHRGGYLLDTFTGEKVPIVRKMNLYTMRVWVKEDKTADKEGFQWQGK